MAEGFQCETCYDLKAVGTQFEKTIDSYHNDMYNKAHWKNSRSDCSSNDETNANNKAKA